MDNLKRTFIVFFQRLEPSLLMGGLLLAVYFTLDVSLAEQDAPILHYMIDQIYALTGVYVGSQIWRGLFLLSFGVIALTRPAPLAAFTLSFPLVIYGWFAFNYTLRHPEIPYPLIVLMGWGYIVTIILMAVWQGWADAMHRELSLEETCRQAHYEVQRLRAENETLVRQLNVQAGDEQSTAAI